jgi:hypothetical protein
LELPTTEIAGPEPLPELLQLPVHWKVNVEVVVCGVLLTVGAQVAVTVYVPDTQLLEPPVVKVSVAEPAAETIAESVKTSAPFGLVIVNPTEVPEPGAGVTVKVMVPVPPVA